MKKSASYAILVNLIILVVAGCNQPTPSPAPPTPPASPCAPGQDLITVPEIKSEGGHLKAEITLTSGKRTLWGSAGDSRCVQQDLRFFKGRNLLKPGPEDPAFSTGIPIPGPTLRAKVGDLIQVKFLNQVDTQAFANSLDQAMLPGNTTGCDEVRTDNKLRYPNGGDMMPNCLHGSSTANLHFHGTHTTPDTTGDNITLFIRPANRGPDGKITGPDPALVDKTFAEIFDACEKNGTPVDWKKLNPEWTDDQKRLLQEYDKNTPFQGKPGPLPADFQLWPQNWDQIQKGVWPQNQLGAYPYCFRLADAQRNTMGQAPGTHWYHAHKHGSTALNVANGMAGALIIEGQYDDDLRRFYGPGFHDQVLVIEQLSSTPFPATNPATKGPNSVPKPQLSVNGRLNPVVKMKPGEVQLWRIVNAAFRDAVQLESFSQGGPAWRQVAQDGVQFQFANYQTLGSVNNKINMAPANRADLLMKAPLQPGKYTLTVQPNAGLPLDPATQFSAEANITLLTVSVEGPEVKPAQDFIQTEKDFPTFPLFLADVTNVLPKTRVVNFGAAHNMIDGKSFDPNHYSQVMTLNTAEEWMITNEANDKAHPFHIHINPFQITEVFAPNAPGPQCFDNMKPETWKPCSPIQPPYVWWDTFAIPTAKQFNLPKDTCPGFDAKQCPAPIQPYVTCDKDMMMCTETVPGHFKMRSRFVDFTGTYVIHCHILIHEDRGMMELVAVQEPGKPARTKPPYAHH
jgi:FtsP/CotA-like multicopper oxidase with cupredoxin domain